MADPERVPSGRERDTVGDAVGHAVVLPVPEPLGEEVEHPDTVAVLQGDGEAEGEPELEAVVEGLPEPVAVIEGLLLLPELRDPVADAVLARDVFTAELPTVGVAGSEGARGVPLAEAETLLEVDALGVTDRDGSPLPVGREEADAEGEARGEEVPLPERAAVGESRDVSVGGAEGDLEGDVVMLAVAEGVGESVADALVVDVGEGVPLGVVEGVPESVPLPEGVDEPLGVPVREGEVLGVPEGVPERVPLPDAVPLGEVVGVAEGVPLTEGVSVIVPLNDGVPVTVADTLPV